MSLPTAGLIKSSCSCPRTYNMSFYHLNKYASNLELYIYPSQLDFPSTVMEHLIR